MKRLKKKNILAFITLLFLVAITSFLIINNFNKSRYNGIFKVSDVSIKNKTKEKNISNDTFKYEIKYTLESSTGETIKDRTAVIDVKISDEDKKYVTFKRINENNVNSIIMDDGHIMRIEVKGIQTNEENNLFVELLVSNAPSGYILSPTVEVKEKTSSKNEITGTSTIIKTTSLSGKISNENTKKPVSGIEVEVCKETDKGCIDKKITYTNDDGTYTISDIKPGTYKIRTDDKNYQMDPIYADAIENEDVTSRINVRSTSPFKASIKKYIKEVQIDENGKKRTISYNDINKISLSVKNMATSNLSVIYEFVISNDSSKAGYVKVVKDIFPNGMELDESYEKNSEWIKNGNIYYNKTLANELLNVNETKILTIGLKTNYTEFAKNYTNIVDLIGETYHTVNFILDNETISTQSILDTDKVDYLDIPEKEGYEILGWYTDREGKNKYNFNNTVENDLNLYAIYEDNLITVNLKNIVANNPYTEVQKINVGKKVNEPDKDNTASGHEFKCWQYQDDSNYTGVVKEEFFDSTKCFDFDSDINESSKTINLIAVYVKNKYNINFFIKDTINGEYKEYASPITVLYNEVIPEDQRPQDPPMIDEKYVFAGWYESDDEGVILNNQFDFSNKITDNLNLYADYSEDVFNVMFKVGTIENDIFTDKMQSWSVKVKKGNKLTKPSDPIVDGYDFIKWYKEDTFDNEYNDFSKEINTDTTIYGKLSEANVKVIYKDKQNDEWKTVKEENYKKGDLVTNPGEPENQDVCAEFTGWYLNKSGSKIFDFENSYLTDDLVEVITNEDRTKTRTLTLYAIKTNKTITVTILDNCGEFKTETIACGSKPSKVDDIKGTDGKEFKCFKKVSNKNLCNREINTPEELTCDNIDETLTKDTTYTTVYEDMPVVSISHEPTIWTNNSVTVSMNIPDTKEVTRRVINIKNDEEVEEIITKNEEVNKDDYIIEYKIGSDGNWQTYDDENKFIVENNTTVYGRVSKKITEEKGKNTIHIIDNIDKLSPEVNILQQNNDYTTTSSIGIKLKTTDLNSIEKVSGIYNISLTIDGYEFYNSNFGENNQGNKIEEFITQVSTLENNESLQEGTTYSIGGTITDYAGNVTVIDAVSMMTDAGEIQDYVARIIGRNGTLYESEDEYENFSTLKSAINSCGVSEEKCTIQLIYNVLPTNILVESNTILEGQNIVLDLNGVSIKGNKETTFSINKGILQIVDHSENDSSIINEIDTAISVSPDSGSILIIGENEASDDEEGTVIINKPHIIGANYGITNPSSGSGIIKYYDGTIHGVIAVLGNVNTTPYMYAAKVTTETIDEETTMQNMDLNQVTDAEARIGSTYYTKFSEAMKNAKSGDEVTTTQIQNYTVYLNDNIEDEESYNTDSSTNEIKMLKDELIVNIDLRKETGNIVLLGKYRNKGYTNVHYNGYITDEENNIIRIFDQDFSSNDAYKNYNIYTELEANKIYKLHIEKIDETDDYNFYLSELSYAKYENETIDEGIVKSIPLDNVGKFVSENENSIYPLIPEVDSSYKSSFMYEIDLTKETSDKIIEINYDFTIGAYAASYAYGYDQENQDFNINNVDISYNNSNKIYYNSGSTYKTNASYQKVLEAGKYYYITFHFNGPNQGHKINYINLYDDVVSIINPSVTKKGNFGFVSTTAPGGTCSIENKTYPLVNENSTEACNYINQDVRNTKAHAYFIVDLTNSEESLPFEMKYAMNSTNDSFGYVIINESEEISDDDEKLFYESGKNDYRGVNDNKSLSGILEAGKINYIHYVFDYNTFYAPNSFLIDSFNAFKGTLTSDYIVSGSKIVKKIDYENEASLIVRNSVTRQKETTVQTKVMNEEADTVQILKDISLDSKINIDSYTKVIVDLNGHIIRVNGSGKNIENSGDLTIKDSKISDEKLLSYESGFNDYDIKLNGGMIINTNYYAIRGNSNSKLNIESGILYSESTTYSSLSLTSTNLEIGKDTIISSEKTAISSSNATISGDGLILSYDKGISATGTTIDGLTIKSEGYSIDSTRTIINNCTADSIYTRSGTTELKNTTILDLARVESGTTLNVISSNINDLNNSGTTNIQDSILKIIYNANTMTIAGSTNDDYDNILFTNTKILTINSSQFKSTSKIVDNKGTLTLGKNDDNIDNTMILESSSTAIENEGTFKWYDGIIIGEIDKSLSGTVNDSPENYDVSVSFNNDIETLKLSKGDDTEKYVARINDKDFTTLTSALNYIKTLEVKEVTIELLDIIYTLKNHNITDDMNIKIKLNNYNIKSFNNTALLTNEGDLEIYNDNEISSKIYGYTDELIINNNNLSLKKFEINANKVALKNYKTFELDSMIMTSNGKTLEIYDTISSKINSSLLKITEKSSKINLNDINVIYIDNNALNHELQINDTTIKSDVEGTKLINGKGNIKIKDSILDLPKNTYGIYLTNSNLDFDGTIKHTNTYDLRYSNEMTGIYALDSNVTINGGLINDIAIGIQINKINELSTSTLTINSLRIDNSITGINFNGSKMTINDIKLSASDTGINVASNGNNLIQAGKIIGSSKSVFVNEGASLDFGTKLGELKPNGEEDNEVNITNPEIGDNKSKIGLLIDENANNVRIFDGIFTSINNNIQGPIFEVEPNYDLITENGSTFLKQESFVKLKSNNKDYYSLQDALNDAEEIDKITTLRNKVYLSNDETITIPENKDITLEIDHEINAGNEKLLINNGTLTILSSEKIESKKTIVENNKILNIGSKDSTSMPRLNTITGDGIINNKDAQLNIYAANLSSTGSELSMINNKGQLVIDSYDTNFKFEGYNAIYNSGTANLNIPKCDIIPQGYAIKNVDSGVVDITGGVFDRPFSLSPSVKMFYNSANYNAENETGLIRLHKKVTGNLAIPKNVNGERVEPYAEVSGENSYTFYNESGYIKVDYIISEGLSKSKLIYNGQNGIFDFNDGEMYAGTSGIISYKGDLWSSTASENNFGIININGGKLGTFINNPTGIINLCNESNTLCKATVRSVENVGGIYNQYGGINYSEKNSNNNSVINQYGGISDSISLDTGKANIIGGKVNNINISNSSSILNVGSKADNQKTTSKFFESQNSFIDNSTALGYLEIDLTDEIENKLLTLNADVVGEKNVDYAFATILQNNETIPKSSDETGRFMYINGTKQAENYTTTLTAGLKYYLYIGFEKGKNEEIGTRNSLRINSLLINSEENIDLLKEFKLINEYKFILYDQNSTYVSRSNPLILGIKRTSGIYNLYDGMIRASNVSSISPNNVEEGYEVITKELDGVLSQYLDMEPLLLNTETGEEFGSFQAAFNSAEDSKIYKFELLRDVGITSTTSVAKLEAGKNVEIDFKKHNIIANNSTFIENEGNLKLYDSSKKYIDDSKIIDSDTGSLIVNSKFIENKGTFTIDGLNYNSNITYESDILDNNGGIINIKDCKSENSIVKITNKANGTINIENYLVYGTNGKKLIQNNSGVINIINSIFDIDIDNAINNSSGATINIMNNSYLIGNITNNGVLNIDNSKILPFYSYNSSKYNAIDNKTNATLNIQNGSYISSNFTGKYAISNEGTVEANSSTIVIPNIGSSGVEQKGKFTGNNIKSDSCEYYHNFKNNKIYQYLSCNDNVSSGAVFDVYKGTTNINNSELTSSNSIIYNEKSGNSPDVYVKNSVLTSKNNITVYGQKIRLNLYLDETSKVISLNSDAIKGGSGLTYVYLGTKDDTINNDFPHIQGKEYGLGERVYYYFYDGKIIGNIGKSTYNVSSGLVDGYEENVITNSEEEYEIKSLKKITQSTVENFRVNGQSVENLEEALALVEDNVETTITLMSDYELNKNIVISSTKKIIFDYNGFKLTKGEYTITNNGTVAEVNKPSDSDSILSASVLKTLVNNTKLEKNIIIYSDDEGNMLESGYEYELYLLTNGDYEKIDVVEVLEDVGRYTISTSESLDKMVPINGRIYINKIPEGYYKIISSNGKEITFNIYEDGKLSSNVKENYTSEDPIILSSSKAQIITNIQTGNSVFKFGILATLITIIIGLLAMIKKQKNYE